LSQYSEKLKPASARANELILLKSVSSGSSFHIINQQSIYWSKRAIWPLTLQCSRS